MTRGPIDLSGVPVTTAEHLAASWHERPAPAPAPQPRDEAGRYTTDDEGPA